jgi:hypothetical protein
MRFVVTGMRLATFRYLLERALSGLEIGSQSTTKSANSAMYGVKEDAKFLASNKNERFCFL